jgi:hypothetical protein
MRPQDKLARLLPLQCVNVGQENKAKIQDDTKEFFSIRMLEEAESYFSSLLPEHRHWLVDSLVTSSVEMKELDVKLVSEPLSSSSVCVRRNFVVLRSSTSRKYSTDWRRPWMT